MYSYTEEKPNLFTESGQEMFIRIRDNVHAGLKSCGAIRAQEAWRGVTGSSWTMLACMDRLVETGEIREIFQPVTVAQYRIFVSAKG